MNKSITLILMGLLLNVCEKSPTEPEIKTKTVTFINKTWKTITIEDNSGRSMFEQVKVLEHSTKTLTYECPKSGSCDIDLIYTYQAIYGPVCICTEGYTRGKSYTFGFCPNDKWNNAEEMCGSCSNYDCSWIDD